MNHNLAFPSAVLSEIGFCHASTAGCEGPDDDHSYRVLYQSIEDHKWHNEAQGEFALDAKSWASELLFYQHTIATAVVNRNGNVIWAMTKSAYHKWLLELASKLATPQA